MNKFALIALAFYGFTAGAFAAGKPRAETALPKVSRHELLVTIADQLNSYKTVAAAADRILPLAKDRAALEKEFGQAALQSAFPKAHAEKDMLVFDTPSGKVTLAFQPATGFLVNGKPWRYNPLAPPVEEVRALQKILATNTTWEDWVVPSAMAVDPATAAGVAIGVYGAGAVVAGGVCAATEVDWHGPIGKIFGVPYCAFYAVAWPALAAGVTMEALDKKIHKMGVDSKYSNGVLFPVALKCPAENQGKLEVEMKSAGGHVKRTYVLEDYSADKYPDVPKTYPADPAAPKQYPASTPAKVLSYSGVVVDYISNDFCDAKGRSILDASNRHIAYSYNSCTVSGNGRGVNFTGDDEKMKRLVETYEGICKAPAGERQRAQELFARNGTALSAWYNNKTDLTDPAAPEKGEQSAQ